jgi:hypothetical protein
MKNIHLISTDKPSRLRYFDSRLEIMNLIPKKSDIVFQNIYITNDEKIKEGDWCLDIVSNYLYKAGITPETSYPSQKKIILTTDQDLISDGIEQISEDVLLKIVEHVNSGKNIESFDEL